MPLVCRTLKSGSKRSIQIDYRTAIRSNSFFLFPHKGRISIYVRDSFPTWFAVANKNEQVRMKLLETKKNWIFDMDGTLTVAMHDFGAIKQELGLPADSDILTSINLLPSEEAKSKHIHLNEIEWKIAKKAIASPGSSDLLQQIRNKSHRLGILTRNCFENSIETLRASGLGEYFSSEYVLCREHAEPKPSPEGILNLLNLWNAKPEETLMIGDYLFDLEAGMAAGVETIYIDPDGIFPFRKFATHCVQRLDEILNL